MVANKSLAKLFIIKWSFRSVVTFWRDMSGLFHVGESTLGIFPTKYFEVGGLYLRLTCSLNLPYISRSLKQYFSSPFT